MDAERSAFEAWAVQNDVSLRLSPDGTDYDEPGTRACWAVWWHLTNRAALAAQPAQAGEPVAWAIKDVHGDFINACVYKSERAAKKDIWHFDGGGSAELAPGAPHTAVPIYAAPSRPVGASQEQAGEAVVWHRVKDGDTVIAGGRKITMRVEPFRADPHPSRPGGAA